MFATVILSSCKAPEHLRRVLAGYARQSTRRFEIVVAEDGSDEATLAVIREARLAMGVDLRHVSQEHRGFRKPRILNRAIQASRSEYLIFSDGDCVPRPDFVSQHLAGARVGRFLSGGTIRLSRDVTEQIRPEDIAGERVHDVGWLTQRQMRLSPKWRWLQQRPGLAAVFDRLTTTRPTFNGHNASAWKQDVLNVNGFDERMGYGGLDRELGERLENAGIRGLQWRHRAICLHLDHERGYVYEQVIRRNRLIRATTRQSRTTWASFGLSQ